MSSLSAHYEAEDNRVRLDITGDPNCDCVSIQRREPDGSVLPLDTLTCVPLDRLGMAVYYDYTASIVYSSLYKAIFYRGKPATTTYSYANNARQLLFVESIAEAWMTPRSDTYWLKDVDGVGDDPS